MRHNGLTCHFECALQLAPPAHARSELSLPLEFLHSVALPYRYLAPHCLGTECTGAGSVKNRMNNKRLASRDNVT